MIHTLHKQTEEVIKNYIACTSGNGTTSIPYHNNRRVGQRGGLAVLKGKGSPKEIQEEAELLALRDKIQIKDLTPQSFKQFLVNHSIGIDCSGFIYHVLNAESIARSKGELKNHLTYPFVTNPLRKLFVKFRSVENTGVNTFAHDLNSRTVNLKDIRPGDFISMTYNDERNNQHNHIILISEVEEKNGIPVKLRYNHSMAWPTDGQYNHGVKQGVIQIIDSNAPITKQQWIEQSDFTAENYTLERAQNADKTELRRLNWF